MSKTEPLISSPLFLCSSYNLVNCIVLSLPLLCTFHLSHTIILFIRAVIPHNPDPFYHEDLKEVLNLNICIVMSTPVRPVTGKLCSAAF